jgi:hypothetical protein
MRRELRLLAAVRGVRWQTLAWLVVAVVVAVVASRVSILLRTPADRQLVSPGLDTGILVGLTAPVAVLGNLLHDRAPWLLATSARPARGPRVLWLATLTTAAIALGWGMALVIGPQVSRLLVFADFSLLYALAVLTGVLAGGQLSWLCPALVAVVASTPRSLPIHLNVVVQAKYDTQVLGAAALALAIGGVLFVVFDEYGLSREARLFRRTSLLSDE